FAVLTFDRHLHFFDAEGVQLPFIGTQPIASFDLRQTLVRVQPDKPLVLVLKPQTKRSAVLGLRAPLIQRQSRTAVVEAPGEEECARWTQAICNPLKDFGAPEILDVGTTAVEEEGLSSS
ncbi:unnamed protein product, partial [Heterosigma akashiwo]